MRRGRALVLIATALGLAWAGTGAPALARGQEQVPSSAATAPRDPAAETPLEWLLRRRQSRATRREELARQAAKSPSWSLHESEHYFIFSGVSDPAFLSETRLRLEAVRAQLVREYPPRTPIGSPNLPSMVAVVIAKNRTQYHEYGGPGGSGGYYSRSKQELVFYDDVRGGGRRESWASLHQVATLAYFGEALDPQERLLPSWFTYGIAGVYEGLRLGEDGRLVPTRRDPRATELRELFEGGKLVPLRDLLAFRQREFMGNNDHQASGRQTYLQAWAFALFVRSAGPQALVWEERWGGILDRYLEALQDGKSRDEAHAAAFAGIDLEELEAAWRAWVSFALLSGR